MQKGSRAVIRNAVFVYSFSFRFHPSMLCCVWRRNGESTSRTFSTNPYAFPRWRVRGSADRQFTRIQLDTIIWLREYLHPDSTHRRPSQQRSMNSFNIIHSRFSKFAASNIVSYSCPHFYNIQWVPASSMQRPLSIAKLEQPEVQESMGHLNKLSYLFRHEYHS